MQRTWWKAANAQAAFINSTQWSDGEHRQLKDLIGEPGARFTARMTRLSPLPTVLVNAFLFLVSEEPTRDKYNQEASSLTLVILFFFSSNIA